jgi:hypothetical protein
MILLTSTSQVAGIISMSHGACPELVFLNIVLLQNKPGPLTQLIPKLGKE